MKSAAGRLFGRLSMAKKLTFAVLVLGVVAAAGLGAVIAARFHANLTATPEQAKGAWLERWWMGVQESIKQAE